MYVDRSDSGGMTNTTAEGGSIPTPTGGLAVQSVELRLFIDRSIIEVFALGGRGRVASRIYPSGAYNWGLSAFGGMAADGAVWSLDSAWLSAPVS